MKITIDTKEDSHEDIRRVIRMLQHLAGEKDYSNQDGALASIPETPENVFGNIFGDDAAKKEEQSETKTTEESPSEENKDIPEIVPY